MKKIIPFLLFVSLIALSSCMNVKDLEVKEVKSLKVKEVTKTGVALELLMDLNNPNGFGFSIYPSEFDVTYSGVYLGKAKLAKRVKIQANATESYTFVLKNDFKDLNLMDVMRVLGLGSFKDLLEIKGDLKAGKFLMKKRFKIDYKEKIGLN